MIFQISSDAAWSDFRRPIVDRRSPSTDGGGVLNPSNFVFALLKVNVNV